MPLSQRLVEIAAFQRGPQDLPYSPRALVGIIAVGATINLIALELSPLDASPWATLAVFFAYTAAFVDGVLQLRGLRHRRVQTLLAVFGTDVVIVAVQTLALGIGHWERPNTTLLVVGLILLGWQLAIITHILKHALSCGVAQAAAWTMAYWLGTELLLILLTGGNG